ncbi:methionine--tRNA ligase [Tundrisphaera sp. TA3]|uniref:methionine--tRNA ligase n=1 Tax=Tundrisphaera sp. TA3 TaxID=3435775 RepID=UPI003EBC05B6
MGSSFYITTAIDYPNSRPHIGTAFEKIGADVQARFRRMEGDAVHFLMGNDENTIKVTQRAAELGVEPKPYVDDMARQFRSVWEALEISNDDFIQTSEERHHVGCQKFIQAVYDAGDIYKKAYTGLYCDGCEAFKTEKEIVDGRCPNHPNRELRQVEEENYFFRLSAFADRLLAHYEAHPDFIQPESRRNEILSLVKAGLQDVSISRKGFTWGIPVPFDPNQTIYVWFDALLNYVTAIGYGTDPERFDRTWPADVHVIGKDITRFHCALWPAMLMSAGLPLPKRVFGHGFVYRKDESTGELQKLSKSLGNVVEPMDIVEQFSAEGFRFYFMDQCPFGGDGEFSFERFAETYNAKLANNLGNLYSRTLSMCVKYFGGTLANAATIDPTAWRAGLDLAALADRLRDQVGAFQYNTALLAIWTEVLDAANRYIEVTKPFTLVKSDPAATEVVMVNLADALRAVAILIKPFLPATAETFYRAFNFAEARGWDDVRYADAATPTSGIPLRVTADLVDGKPAPLFPKIDLKAGAR